MRKLALLLALIVVALAFASKVAAVPPTIIQLPNPGEVVSEDCGFPVLIAFPRFNGTTRTFTDQNGDFVKEVDTGVIIATLTNLDTGKRVTVNISGPFEFRLHSDGSETESLVGPYLFIFGALSDVVGSGIVYHTGLIRVELDTAGNVTSIKEQGHTVNLCSQLAS